MNLQNSISIDDCFSFINEKGPVLVAVSGGSDSMALLFLANAWATKNGRDIQAVTVDHGLRAEAAAEAAFVAMVCEGLGVEHITLAWEGPKPSAGISAAARHARYDLICEYASEFGIRIILTGHTQDDQAETVLMRLKRSSADGKSSARGHSGMCKRVLLGGDGEGVFLLRPLLDLTRQQLRRYLNEISQSWIEDPSNFDESYERVRIRNGLANDAQQKSDLIAYSAVMGRMRQVVSRDCVKLLAQSCICSAGHVYKLDIRLLSNAPGPIVLMAIKSVIATAGGAEFLVSDGQAGKVLDLLEQGLCGRLTLGNCLIEVKEDNISIHREARNLIPALVPDGARILWDGRVHIHNDCNETVRIEPMTTEYLAGVETPYPIDKTALLSSPLIITATGEVIPLYFDPSSLPAQLDVRTGARAIENFCPEWDFCLLEWIKGIDLENQLENDLDSAKQ